VWVDGRGGRHVHTPQAYVAELERIMHARADLDARLYDRLVAYRTARRDCDSFTA
jgi:hypothetical protein